MTEEEKDLLAKQLFSKAYALHKGRENGKPDPDAAVSWYEKAIKLGHTGAMVNLGNIHADRKDYEKTYHWYLEAALAGDADGLQNIGYLYFHGKFVDQDYRKAYDYFLKAYEKGVSTACLFLGHYAEEGILEEPDYEKAIRYYREGMGKGVSACCIMLGAMYAIGKGVERNLWRSMAYYRAARKRGNIHAYYGLGWCFENWMDRKPVHVERAVAFYREGAAKGNAQCIKALERLKKTAGQTVSGR